MVVKNKKYDHYTMKGSQNPNFGNYKFDITKEQLENLYKNNSIRKISQITNINVATIFKYLKRFGIKTREKRIPIGKYRGEKSWNWKGGISSINNLCRNNEDYRKWRKSVFMRDYYTCQECGCKPKAGFYKELNAHHIKSFSLYPELRYDLDNGITLCEECHSKKHPNVRIVGNWKKLKEAS